MSHDCTTPATLILQQVPAVTLIDGQTAATKVQPFQESVLVRYLQAAAIAVADIDTGEQAGALAVSEVCAHRLGRFIDPWIDLSRNRPSPGW
jgi:hypothetical protein